MRGGREGLLGLGETLFLIIFPSQCRLCLPEELLPVATSSVWVRGPRAGRWGVLRYRGIAFGQEDAKGLRKLCSVRGKGGSEGGSERLQKAMVGFIGAGWDRKRVVKVGVGLLEQ